MRGLSHFAGDSFDVVYQSYSINFVPNADTVLDEVARIMRMDGIYHLGCANPMTHAVDSRAWNGTAYPLSAPYVEEAEIIDAGDHWKVPDDDGAPKKIQGPREFRHTITTLLSGLIDSGFVLLRVMDTRGNTGPIPDGAKLEPGSWEHYESIAPRSLLIWAAYRPNAYAGLNMPRPA